MYKESTGRRLKKSKCNHGFLLQTATNLKQNIRNYLANIVKKEMKYLTIHATEKPSLRQAVVMHSSNPCIRGRGRQISEFKATLVYRLSSRTARATQRNPVSKKYTTFFVHSFMHQDIPVLLVPLAISLFIQFL